jgi:hypothetical protein
MEEIKRGKEHMRTKYIKIRLGEPNEDKEIIKKVMKGIDFRENNIDSSSFREGHGDLHYVEDYCYREDVKKALKKALKLKGIKQK